jgi:hypothetical protein
MKRGMHIIPQLVEHTVLEGRHIEGVNCPWALQLGEKMLVQPCTVGRPKLDFFIQLTVLKADALGFRQIRRFEGLFSCD